MLDFILGAAKALVAGLVAGGGALLLYLHVPAELVAVLGVILGPLAVYLVPNLHAPATLGAGALSPEQVAPPAAAEPGR